MQVGAADGAEDEGDVAAQVEADRGALPAPLAELFDGVEVDDPRADARRGALMDLLGLLLAKEP